MRKADVVIGEHYTAKVSNAVVIVRIDRESRYGGWEATNVFSDRRVRIKTAGRLRRHVPETPVKRMIGQNKAVKQYQKEKAEREVRLAQTCPTCGK